MAQGFTPIVEFYGANAALLNQRIMRWSHTDAAGIESDRLELTLNIEGLEGLPSLSGKVGMRVGYSESGLVEKGEFVITQRTPVLFPMRLMIVATAAPFQRGRPTRLPSASFRQLRAYHPGGAVSAIGRPAWFFTACGAVAGGHSDCPHRPIQRKRYGVYHASGQAL